MKTVDDFLANLFASGGGWQPLRPGVEKWTLLDGPDGEEVALLRYLPGAWVPRHRHQGREVIYVLQGSQSDEKGTYSVGQRVVNETGTEHSVKSVPGCLVLIAWEKPVVFLDGGP